MNVEPRKCTLATQCFTCREWIRKGQEMLRLSIARSGNNFHLRCGYEYLESKLDEVYNYMDKSEDL